VVRIHSFPLRLRLTMLFGVLIIANAPLRAANTDFVELSADRVKALASMIEERPRGFGPTCANRDAWSAVEVTERTVDIRRVAEKLLTQEFPSWDPEAYLEYSRKGLRPNGERMMNARKAWLYPLTLAECVEGKGRFLPTIERTLTELIEQPTWTWPAHDRTLRNFNDHHYEVDLLSADTAHEIAEVLYLLGNRLRPELRQRVLSTVDERVFAPLRKTFSSGNKDNWWLHADHNWNAVCLKGAVAAALTVLPDRMDRAVFVAAAEQFIQNYVAGFSLDGYTSEGPGYWNYGFSHFSVLREALMQTSEGRIDLFGNPKVRSMAMYGYRIEMLPGNIAAFGDASPKTRMDEFTRAYANDVLALGQSQHLKAVTVGSSQSANDSPLVKAVLLLFGNPKVHSGNIDQESTSASLQSYFDSVGVLVSRPALGDKLAITIKAGGNGNHSHNDIGSYTIGVGGEQPVGDVGNTQYSSKTFGKERYTIAGISSWGHPVPIVAGALQDEADKIKPRVTSTHFSDDIDEITINMADAYSTQPMKSLTRQMVHDRRHGGAVTIDDRFEFSNPNSFEVAITTLGNWKQNEDGTLEFWQKNEHLIARIEASGPWILKTDNSNEEGLSFTRLGIQLKEAVKRGYVKVRFGLEHP